MDRSTETHLALFGDNVDEVLDADAVHVGYQHGAEVDGGRFRIHQLADQCVPVLPFTLETVPSKSNDKQQGQE